MTWVAFIRHGRTTWNESGRLQGRADPPLSAAGRAELEHRRLPEELARAEWVTSPLRRAVETARLLGAADAVVEPRLVEMDWGAWEGRTLADLRAELGSAMVENEARGLDLQPEGGESPRQVQARLRPWLAEVAQGGRSLAAVSHKGVIRAVAALAYDWDMTGPPPVKFDWRCAQLFELSPDGAPTPLRANITLAAA
jgi:probable phosphoglycerate mutase